MYYYIEFKDEDRKHFLAKTTTIYSSANLRLGVDFVEVATVRKKRTAGWITEGRVG